MTMKKIVRLLFVLLLAAPTLFAIDNLKLNPHLDYGSDSARRSTHYWIGRRVGICFGQDQLRHHVR